MPEPQKVTDGILSHAKTYPGLREFSEWHPWGWPPNHTTINDNYIPVRGGDQRQFDYPAAMKRMMDHTWKAANVPTGFRGGSGLLSASHRFDTFEASTERIEKDELRAQEDLDRRRAFGRDKASAWYQMKEIKQVAAYTFRGDTRRAEEIHNAGGFYPPSMRTDDYYQSFVEKTFAQYLIKMQNRKATPQAVAECAQAIKEELGGQGSDLKMLAEYHSWRGMFRREEMHIGQMTVSPFLKGYVSTTRDMTVAVEGARGVLATDMLDLVTGANGWIYAVRVEPGFLLKQGVGGATKDEAEVAHLGPILWKDVYGFRCFTEHPALKDRIYIRYGFDTSDNVAFRLVLGSLSRGLKGEIQAM